MKSFLKYWIPLYIYAGLIFYFSSLPRTFCLIGIPYFDKILHIGEYTIFSILVSRAFKNSSREILHKHFQILALLVTFTYGISDEFHQFFVSYRACDVFDVISDWIGGTIGIFIYGRYHPF